jgi:hypothetical protein
VSRKAAIFWQVIEKQRRCFMAKNEKENKEIFKWHGWASPVGVGIFFVCCALTLLLLAQTAISSVESARRSVLFEQMKAQ